MTPRKPRRKSEPSSNYRKVMTPVRLTAFHRAIVEFLSQDKQQTGSDVIRHALEHYARSGPGNSQAAFVQWASEHVEPTITSEDERWQFRMSMERLRTGETLPEPPKQTDSEQLWAMHRFANVDGDAGFGAIPETPQLDSTADLDSQLRPVDSDELFAKSDTPRDREP